MPRFREISIEDLGSLVFPRGQPVKLRQCVHPSAVVDVPAVAFGYGASADMGALRYQAGEVWRWRLGGVLVHGPYGVLTVDDHVITDSLLHVPFTDEGYSREGGLVQIPPAKVRHRIGRGLHAASGNFGNYYHWMLDIVPKLQLRPFSAEDFPGTILLPPAGLSCQHETAQLLLRHGHRVTHLRSGEAIHVDRLDFLPNMTGAGHAPHPCLAQFFDSVAAAFGPLASGGGRRIYVSRQHATNRRLLNEAAVIALLAESGYEVVDTAAMPMAEQIAMFAQATHIVAPHGAGLANIMFCAPGTRLCELQMDRYMNLCFRKLAALRGLVYGCVVGEADAQSHDMAWEHGMEWSVDLKRVKDALGHMS